MTVPDFVQLQTAEITLIDQYRRQKSTSVLTILFTDIEGFTDLAEKFGEAFSNQFRLDHDNILVPIIESRGGGRVIKHMGDAIMAVFSEPSTAVARAIEIQDKIREFNRTHPDQPRLSVRMGLHTGQVTMEENVSLDIFGRHVNRAARVQALAKGGQVLMTYPVYDSARGWLASHQGEQVNVAWKDHGHYHLKGIQEDIQIFEAYDPSKTQPIQPPGALSEKSRPSKNRFFPSLVAIAVVVCLALLIGYLYSSYFASATVQLVDFTYENNVKLDGDHEFVADGQNGDHIRNVLTPLKPGHHLLSGDISDIVRLYADLDVKPGKNVILLQFNRVELPGASESLDYAPTGPNELTRSTDEDFVAYDSSNKPRSIKGHIDLKIKAAPAPDGKGKIAFDYDWVILHDGKEITRGHHQIIADPAQTDSKEERMLLFKDEGYFYHATFQTSGTHTQCDIEANFADYLSKMNFGPASSNGNGN